MKRFGLGLITLSVFAIGGPHYSDSYYLTDEFEVSEYTKPQNQQPCTWISWAVTCSCSGIFSVLSWCYTDSQSEWERSKSVSYSLGIYSWKWKTVGASQITAFWLLWRRELNELTASCINLICLAYQMSLYTFQESCRQWDCKLNLKTFINLTLL